MDILLLRAQARSLLNHIGQAQFSSWGSVLTYQDRLVRMGAVVDSKRMWLFEKGVSDENSVLLTDCDGHLEEFGDNPPVAYHVARMYAGVDPKLLDYPVFQYGKKFLRWMHVEDGVHAFPVGEIISLCGGWWLPSRFRPKSETRCLECVRAAGASVGPMD